MKRVYFISTILIIMMLVLTSCASPSTNGDDTQNGGEDQIVITLSELAEYDGKDGNPAYVAVDGVIYDVTNSDMWSNGEHNGFEAGKDLTEEINSAPHGTSTLSRMPVVGEIID